MEIVQPSRVNNNRICLGSWIMDHGYGTGELVVVSDMRRRTIGGEHPCGMLDMPRLDAFNAPACVTRLGL